MSKVKELSHVELEKLALRLEELESEQDSQLELREFDEDTITLSVTIYDDETEEQYEQDDMILDRETLEVIND